jgi:glycosyltransferase involved in cell wall biosynthesis
LKILILTFSYNDWPSAQALLGLLDEELRRAGLQANVLLVDDASTDAPPAGFAEARHDALPSVNVLRLRQNLGHQRAIAVGFCHAHAHCAFDAMVVMDADGEDLPADAIRLIRHAQETGNREVIFAERSRRSESLLFRFFYHLYRLIHVVLTGKGVRVGNFSIIPKELVGSLVVEPNLWNHYAAAVFNSRLPRTTIPTHRGKRLHGQNHLNFTSLVIHGLSAISCYSEIIGVRVLLVSLLVSCALVLAIAATVVIRFATDLAIPGWATTAVGILLMVLLQILSLAALFTLSILTNRKSGGIIPIRDYAYWVASIS